MAAPSVVATGVSKRFRIYHEKNLTLKSALLRRRRGRFESFWALREVSFEVRPGSALGVIGANGSGKSTLLKCIAGILRSDSGGIEVKGRLAELLELGAGFFGEYSGRENVYLQGALLGLPRRYIDSVLGEIIEFSGLERFIDNAVKTYSSGMFARLGFAVAVHLDPDVLLVDEILAVGDEAFQRKCFDRIAQMRAQGKTMLVVSHSLDMIKDICGECLWLESGDVKAQGPSDKVIDLYLNRVNEVESEALLRLGRGAEIRPPLEISLGPATVMGPGGPSAVVETGDSIEIHLEYRADRALRGAQFVIEIVREDGVLATMTMTDKDEAKGQVLAQAGTVVLAIPKLPLLEGLYRIGARVQDYKGHETYASLEQSVPFRVLSSKIAERGLTHLGHHWELPLQSERSVSA